MWGVASLNLAEKKTMEANGMGYLKYVKHAWKNPSQEVKDLWRARLIAWRKEPVTVRLEHPTRPDRARAIGYRAKQGILIIRQRVNRGGRMRPKITGGRAPKQMRRRKIVGMSYQWVAEQRTAKKYPNCEVLHSYFVAKDGKHAWYEILLVDRNHPVVMNDARLNWISTDRGRVYRGLTAAGKRSRGILTHKGKGAEKLRPSLRANKRLAK